MRLDELVNGMEGVTAVRGDPSLEVTDLTCDSRKVVPGSLFFAVPGEQVDGAGFVGEALGRGACAVLARTGAVSRTDCVVVEVEGVRRVMGDLAARFFGYPSKELTLVGVTGTNGKTSFTYLMESILKQAGFQPGVIGTVSCRYRGQATRLANTTPEPLELQRTLREMRNAGVTHVLLEVSSHGLDARRVDACDFAGAVFTMLGRDHLDHHGDVETYFASKARLFTELLPASAVKSPWAVINRDDPHGERLLGLCPVPAVAVGSGENAEYRIESAFFGREGTSLEVHAPGGIRHLESPLIGKVNAMNLLLAVAASDRLGVDVEAVAQGVGALEKIPGRLERVARENGALFLVDYAHTPDALDHVLPGLRELTPGRLITVFGCGGDRDRGKRPLMGAAAARWSDIVLVTSDNPRSEPPEEILREIRQGIDPLGVHRLEPDEVASLKKGEKAYICLADRRSAIRRAVRAAGRGDTVLVAGKGHEDVQILGKTRVPFRDDEEVLCALRGRSEEE
jgi:UDP-N-acetylmuramoyl-L-alanyl-D-glutamate--2,6-diaminopimelate ligase